MLNYDSAYEFYAAKLRTKDRKFHELSDKVNDKSKIEKFSNYKLYTQREM